MVERRCGSVRLESSRGRIQIGETEMKSISASDIAKMPVRDRIQLVQDIWDSIAEMPQAIEVPDWHKRELERRLAEYHASPEEGSPWKEVRKRILGRD